MTSWPQNVLGILGRPGTLSPQVHSPSSKRAVGFRPHDSARHWDNSQSNIQVVSHKTESRSSRDRTLSPQREHRAAPPQEELQSLSFAFQGLEHLKLAHSKLKEELLRHLSRDHGLSKERLALMHVEFKDGSLIAEIGHTKADTSMQELQMHVEAGAVILRGVVAETNDKEKASTSQGSNGHARNSSCSAAALLANRCQEMESRIREQLAKSEKALQARCDELERRCRTLIDVQEAHTSRLASLESSAKALAWRPTYQSAECNSPARSLLRGGDSTREPSEDTIQPFPQGPGSTEASIEAVAATVARRIASASREELEGQVRQLRKQYGHVTKELDKVKEAAALAQGRRLEKGMRSFDQVLVEALALPSEHQKEAQQLALKLLGQASEVAVLLLARDACSDQAESPEPARLAKQELDRLRAQCHAIDVLREMSNYIIAERVHYIVERTGYTGLRLLTAALKEDSAISDSADTPNAPADPLCQSREWNVSKTGSTIRSRSAGPVDRNTRSLAAALPPTPPEEANVCHVKDSEAVVRPRSLDHQASQAKQQLPSPPSTLPLLSDQDATNKQPSCIPQVHTLPPSPTSTSPLTTLAEKQLSLPSPPSVPPEQQRIQLAPPVRLSDIAPKAGRLDAVSMAFSSGSNSPGSCSSHESQRRRPAFEPLTTTSGWLSSSLVSQAKTERQLTHNAAVLTPKHSPKLYVPIEAYLADLDASTTLRTPNSFISPMSSTGECLAPAPCRKERPSGFGSVMV